ncbi:MAG: hypothetical protein J7M19_05945 [Planctomycetes bacterium]|nr:hypothetical protein [Planctomycetota bacterium]
MSTRVLWQNIMNYGTFDRMPVTHWASWPETTERWHTEGMPSDILDRRAERKYFRAAPEYTSIGVNLKIFPPFEEETLEETDDYRIFRDESGIVTQDWKHKTGFPRFIDWTFKTADDWPEFKKRLQPCPERIPDDLDSQIAHAESTDAAIGIKTGSMIGRLRNWMGLINVSYFLFDAPDVYADFVDTISNLVCWGIDQVIPRMKGIPDIGFGWEDICGKDGPLVNLAVFDRYTAPGYTKIRNKLEEYGVKLLAVDSDGYVEPLIRHWLDAGVNVMFPMEIGTWNADPYALRKTFGKELHIIGGFNKLVLEKTPADIDAEIERLLPLAAEGGFIMMPDHHITPGAPLENYKYYLEKVRALRF